MRIENLPIKSGKRNQLLQINHGGTAADNNKQALINLGALDPDLVDRPGGVAGLNENGFIRSDYIPTELGTVNPVNIEGPDQVQVTGAVFCYITNFDDFTDYSIQAYKVAVTREGNILAVQGEIEGNDAWFSVNGSKYPLTVTAAPMSSGNPQTYYLAKSANLGTASAIEFGNTLEISNDAGLSLVSEPNYHMTIVNNDYIGYSSVVNSVGQVTLYTNASGSFVESTPPKKFTSPSVELVYNIAADVELFVFTDTGAQYLLTNSGTLNVSGFGSIVMRSSGGARISTDGGMVAGSNSTVTIGDFTKIWNGQAATGEYPDWKTAVIYKPNENRRFGEVIGLAKAAQIFGAASPRWEGSPIDNGGEVTFFYKIAGNWTPQLVTKPRGIVYPAFGSALKFSDLGSDVLVGCKGSNLVYHYNRTNGAFSELGQFTKAGLSDTAKFGAAIDATADLSTVVVGAPGEGTYGTICIFTKVGNNFTHLTSLTPVTLTAGMKIGNVVKINKAGTKIFVSAYSVTANDGLVIEYSRTEIVPGTVVWAEASRIVNPIPSVSQSKFGYSLDLGGAADNILSIGAPGSVTWDTPGAGPQTAPATNCNGNVHLFVNNNYRWTFYTSLGYTYQNSHLMGYGSKTRMAGDSFKIINTSKAGLFYNAL